MTAILIYIIQFSHILTLYDLILESQAKMLKYEKMLIYLSNDTMYGRDAHFDVLSMIFFGVYTCLYINYL